MARKPSPPREIGIDHAAISMHHPEEIVPLRNHNGIALPTRRYISPFVSLRDTGTLTPNQSVNAGRFMALYAQSRGISGAPERDEVVVDQDRSGHDYAFEAIARARGSVWAGDELARIERKIGGLNHGLLIAMCREFMEGDTTPVRDSNGKPLVRWRECVKAYYKSLGKVIATPNEQNLVVWIACRELDLIFSR